MIYMEKLNLRGVKEEEEQIIGEVLRIDGNWDEDKIRFSRDDYIIRELTYRSNTHKYYITEKKSTAYHYIIKVKKE